jgi:replicative DNA helicase
MRVVPGTSIDVPPHSIEAERTILGSCLLQPHILPTLELSRADFYSEAHGRIWSALVYLAAEGVPVDSLTLRQRLVDVGQHASVGGDDYLLGLTDTIPTLENAAAHAAIVRRLAQQRAAQAHAARGARSAAAGDIEDAQTAIREAARALDGAEGKPKLAWSWLSESIPTLLKPVGARLQTGFATLDEATRGGIPVGRFVVLAGAPGASKTTLAVYLASRWERAGATVVYLAADEPADGVTTRFGQLGGWNREGLEEEGAIGDSTRAGFAERMRGRRIAVLDPDDAGLSIEDAAGVLHEAADGPLRVLVVDSLQTARCTFAAGLDSVRERMDATVHACKRIARSGVLVLAISEMSRAGYNGKDMVSALASSKESGSIEYGVSLLLGLRTAKDAPGQYDVEVAKNRIGCAKPAFRLRLDFATASLSEIAAPTAPAAPGSALDQDVYLEEVRKVLSTARRPLSANTISDASSKQRAGMLKAVARLEYDGELVKYRNGFWLSRRGVPPE